ncbi:MAG TPA: hypothetical protein VG692_07990 [Gemmatimonadales bacterium]|nr:hypothetical protein [Gemmatimonadales bacterium]
MSRTATLVHGLLGGFRRLAALALGEAVLGGLALVLGLAAWAARLGWFGEPWWVLAAWGLVAVALGLAVWFGRQGLRRLSPAWLAGEIEQRGFRRGALAGHLEPAAAGVSPDLLALADERQAEELSARARELVATIGTPFRRRAVQAAVTLLAGLAVLGSARPTRGAPSLLWRPGEAWEATVAPISIALSDREVERGQQVTVRALARGRQHAILWVRAPGESWRGTGLALDSTGQAATTLGPLETDLFVRLTSGGRASDTLQVRVRIPAFLGSLSVTARYPRYLGLEDEPIPTQGDTVLVPEGTRLETVGEATAALDGARWASGSGGADLSVKGRQFSGLFTPTGTRVWALDLRTATGMPLAGDTVRIPIVTVADSAPRVDVPVPGSDTLAPLSLKLPLVIDAQDDHGLTRVVLESRRISRLGFEDPPRTENIALPEAAGSRAILPWELDLNGRGLLPGDTVRFFVRVTDNAPAAHTARSKEFVLRLPTLSEVRQAARAASNEVGRRLDSIADQSKQLERQTEDLSRERARAAESKGNTDDQLSYDNAKRAEKVSESQEQLLKQAEEVKQALEALRQSAEAAGLNDPAWQQRLQEIQEQLERALTPELRDKLAELQQALKDLDPERTREALEELTRAQKDLRDALERSKELFERAALEGDMANLTAEAKDLAQQQQQWTQKVTAQDSARSAREEQALAAKTDSLASALQKLSSDLAKQGEKPQQAAEQSAQQAKQAAKQMQQAAQSAARGQKQQAQKQGQEASKQLDPVGEQLEMQRQQLQSEWKQEVIQQLDNALADASRLAERQLEVSEAFRRGEVSPQVRSEQGAIKEGAERLLDQVKDIAGKNALVSQQSSVAIAAGRDNMSLALESLANAAPNAREAGRRAGEAVDALNAAAYTLLRSRGAVEGSGSGSGLPEAMQQMQQMAQQQGNIGQQSAGMLPQMGSGNQMQEQLRQLGAQQRQLAEQLERMRAGGQIPGAADLAQEAKDLARSLEAGRLDRQTVERQERLFRRMLDAGRTLQGEEKDEKQERQSTTGKDDSVRLPPALRRTGDADALLRYPSWEELQSLSPEDRRRVVEYFRRLAEQPAAGAKSEKPRSER